MSRQIVRSARRWIGTPYRHGESLRGWGCDCLGLVRGVWRETIGEEPWRTPAYRPDWDEIGVGEPLLAALERWFVPVERPRPGDVVVFRMHPLGMAKHCAIVTADDGPRPGMVHAYWGRAVTESWMSRWWQGRRVAAFAFPRSLGPIDDGGDAWRRSF